MFPAGFDKNTFLKNHWQQQSTVLKALFTDLIDCINGDDLAGLSCESEVESRIISGSAIDGPWGCVQGPMTEQTFAELPEKNWTLLVQGVDQWDELIHSLLSRFDFLPRWRLEDVMASYAPVGGGVGPHFDYYDVFLIQVSGVRQWQLGQVCDEATPLQDGGSVKLLQAFNERSARELHPGDAIYIPAGAAHWGTAISDDCITLSVGFRAPSEKEIISKALDNIIESMSEHNRYRDTPAAIDLNPAKINRAVGHHLSALVERLSPAVLAAAVDEAFGQLVTEPRHESGMEQEELYHIDDLNQLLAEQESILVTHAPHSRFAFSEHYLFVNGDSVSVSQTFAKNICEGCVGGQISDDEKQWLLQWLNSGDLSVDESLES